MFQELNDNIRASEKAKEILKMPIKIPSTDIFAIRNEASLFLQ